MIRGHLLLAFTLLLAACSGDPGISRTLARHVGSNSATVDLAAVGPSSWERVCFFGPYSTNQRVEKILGFQWDAEGKSSIARNDGINLLVFVRHQEVVAYTEHPRNKGDVVSLSSRCLSRSSAVLTRQVESGGWVNLVRVETQGRSAQRDDSRHAGEFIDVGLRVPPDAREEAALPASR